MKPILTIFLFLVSLSLINAEDLMMTLKIDRDTVYVADPFFTISLTIKNTSPRPQKVININHRDFAREKGDGLREIIISQAGETLQPTLVTFDFRRGPDPEYLILVTPGESVTNIWYCGRSLYSCFGLGRLKNSVGKSYGFPVRGFSAGTYLIKVVWRNITSNEIILTIKQPEGNLAKAYDLYLEAWCQFHRRKKDEKNLADEEYIRKRLQQAISIITRLERNYNLDPYAPLALDLLFERTAWHFSDFPNLSTIVSSVEIYKKIVENYPNSKIAEYRIVRPYMNKKVCFQSEEEFNNYLKYIEGNFPTTLIGNKAKQALEEREKK